MNALATQTQKTLIPTMEDEMKTNKLLSGHIFATPKINFASFGDTLGDDRDEGWSVR